MSEHAIRLIHAEQKNPTGYLDLGRTGLTEIPKELFELKHLQTLIISNEWQDPEQGKWIECKNEGQDNLIKSIPDSISKLRNLTRLELGGDRKMGFLIGDISPLQNLIALERLNLRHNQIADLSPIQSLNALTTLDLCDNQIQEIRPVEKLNALTLLDLSTNQIADLSPIEKLNALTTLYLRNDQIADLRPIQKLNALTTLYLCHNQIRDIRPIENLNALTFLDLHNNQIADLSPIQSLNALTTLDLCDNQIRDIRPVEKLNALTTLDLRHNQIADLSPLILHLRRGIQVSMDVFSGTLLLQGNPITTPPFEIVAQGNEAILTYFDSLDRS